jgi:histidyl-tRNA synthetase
MIKVKPRIPSGFMELLPQDQIAFNRMFEVIKKTYELFGFTPIETPAVEFTEVLLTKSGGETEKQVWGIQKGDGTGELSLHFDLTIPLARYVAQRHEDLTFPFRRYQMQKVWRGERNQKGRFREFYQCDIDVIGSTNVLIDAEIPSVIFEVFKNLGFSNIMIRINNRKVLNGFLSFLGCSDNSKEILRIVDKIDKQGKEKVAEDLENIGISGGSVTKILEFIEIKGSNEDVVDKLKSLGVSAPLFEEGLKELETVAKAIEKFGVPRENFKLDLSIARGLDYYTGTVYETVLKDYPEIGSVCSGGRFDDLAGYYTDKKLPGVGISIGLTRLFFKLKEAGLIDSKRGTPSKVLIANMGEDFVAENLKVATEIRKNGISTEVYFEEEKIGKQFKYADRLKIPFVIIIGEMEVKEERVGLKIMSTGNQEMMSLNEAIKIIKTTE